jgi:hypothetical protein
MRKIFQIQLGTVAHFIDEIELARTPSDKFRIQIETSKIIDKIELPDPKLRRYMEYLSLSVFMDDPSESWRVIDFLMSD